MGDCDSVMTGLEEENLIAAAKQIMMALRSKKNLTDVTKKTLADLCKQLIALTTIDESEDDAIGEIEGLLKIIQEKFMSWERDQPTIQDLNLDEVTGYLNAADEARKLTERLGILCLNKGGGEKELLRRAHSVLHMVMKRLEEMFKHLLIRDRQQSSELEYMLVSSIAINGGSEKSVSDESFEDSLDKDSINRNSEDFTIDLVQPVAISDLKRVADLMFISGYGFECSQTYIDARRDALDECLAILEIEKLDIKEVMKLELEGLKFMIKRWIQTMKTFVRVYLLSEKWLTEQIFGELGTVSFVRYAEASMLQLLNSGKAISVGPHEPEKLFPILDMYAVLADLLPDIISLYSGNADSRVRIESCEFLGMLADSARAAFLAFVNAITTSRSTDPFPGGGIHHLTMHVMDYLNTLTGYRETFNLLLKDNDGEDSLFMSPAMSSTVEEENISEGSCDFSPMAVHFKSTASIREWLFDGSPISIALEEENKSGGTPGFPPMALLFQSTASILEWHYNGSPMHPAMEEQNRSGSACDFSPMAIHFYLVVSILECSLSDMAKLYKEASLQHVFLMNNIHYMFQKVKNSRLRLLFGDQWIRRYSLKFQQHLMNYERATWSSILSLFKCEDSFFASYVSERLQSFNLAFEEVYRTQTAWSIPDAQLRQDLQISTSLKVIPGYRTFLGRFGSLIPDKHIKYAADDLENYLFDLLEGSPRSLQRRYRNRSTGNLHIFNKK